MGSQKEREKLSLNKHTQYMMNKANIQLKNKMKT